MQDSVILVVVGGAVSLVSILATATLQHWLSLRKEVHETRRYPREILFKKQIEYYDKITPILPGIRGYIMTIGDWLEETSQDEQKAIKQEAGKKEDFIWRFHALMEGFSMYLPDKILHAGNELYNECCFLSSLPTEDRAVRCTELLYSFQNIIRECAGVDKLSEDLFKAFGVKKPERLARSE